MPKPNKNEYGSFYQNYIDQVESDDLMEAFYRSMPLMTNALAIIPAEKAKFAYAENKWTVKQVLQHLIDAERVFAYRALCIARGEKQPLPGFDENSYADMATAEHRKLEDLIKELLDVRKTSLLLFSSFPLELMENSGTASNNPITVRALGYIMIGHVNHHLGILKELYLV